MRIHQPSYSHRLLLLPILSLLAFCMSCVKPSGQVAISHPALVEIDSLLWSRPDSAFMELRRFAECPEADSLDTFDGHCFQLLLSELLYKNDCAQTNREELLKAVGYFDSLASSNKDAFLTFLDARGHYIKGVGSYETDSVVPACEEYLKAVELMENRFREKELVGRKAQFMAFIFTRLSDVFSDQYLNLQTICFANKSLSYYYKYNAEPWQISRMLEEIGIQYEILGKLDSADYYYGKAEMSLTDTDNITYRDVETRRSCLFYKTHGETANALERLHKMLCLSESPYEYITRCMVIGEVHYYEQRFDSAKVYLNKVFLETTNDSQKKQVAEWLSEICQHQGLSSEQYDSYLASFVNQEENQSEIKSLLAELYSTYIIKDKETCHQQVINRQKKRTWIIIGTLTCLVLFSGVIYYRSKRKKKHLETKLLEERHAHQINQKAMGGKLKKSYEALNDKKKENKILHEKLKAYQKQTTWSSYEVFLKEPVCQTILELLEERTIKREAKTDDYPELKLSGQLFSQLEAAVEKHFDGFGNLLTTYYPKITRNEINQCMLYLLNLQDKQIAVLMNNDYSTIKKRTAKLKKAFGTDKPLQQFIRKIVL